MCCFLPAGGEPTILRTGLAAFPDIGTVDFFECSAGVPTLAYLSAYDVVVVMSNAYFYDAVQTGNVLADYVDGGGKVIEAVASFATGAGWELAGRFVTGDYEPFNHGAIEFFYHNLGDFDQHAPNYGRGYGADEYSASGREFEIAGRLGRKLGQRYSHWLRQGTTTWLVSIFFPLTALLRGTWYCCFTTRQHGLSDTG